MAIFDVHHPLVFIFGIIGNIVSICVYLAPIPTFIEILKRKSTMGFEALPYVVSLFSALLWLYYAVLKGRDAFLLITINSLGSFIEFIYIVIFLIYVTPDSKKQTFKVLSGISVVCLAISLGTFFFIQGPTRTIVVGWVCVGVSVCVFAAPLSVLCQVVKTTSVEFMPFPLSCFLTLSAVMWLAYGLFLHDLCVMAPNVVGFLLGVIQMGLYAYYKRASKSKVKIIKEMKLPKHTINMSMQSNSEVHPVDSQTSSSASEAEAEEEKNNGNNEEIFEHSKCRQVVPTVGVDEEEPCSVGVGNVKPMDTPVLIMCAV